MYNVLSYLHPLTLFTPSCFTCGKWFPAIFTEKESILLMYATFANVNNVIVLDSRSECLKFSSVIAM